MENKDNNKQEQTNDNEGGNRGGFLRFLLILLAAWHLYLQYQFLGTKRNGWTIGISMNTLPDFSSER